MKVSLFESHSAACFMPTHHYSSDKPIEAESSTPEVPPQPPGTDRMGGDAIAEVEDDAL